MLCLFLYPILILNMFDHYYTHKPSSLDAAFERGAIQSGFVNPAEAVFPENRLGEITKAAAKQENQANWGQPKPIANKEPEVWWLVQKDMLKRNSFGIDKYGMPLQPNNGRDALKDAYEEALDLVVYLRQALYERDNA